MATLKLTNGAVGGLPPAPKGKQLLYWDAKLPGFGVLVSSSSKSYVVQARVALARRPTRITLGPVGRFKDLDAARNAARDAFADMRSGVHPKAKAREAAAQDVTLRCQSAFNIDPGPASKIDPLREPITPRASALPNSAVASERRLHDVNSLPNQAMFRAQN
jgi:Arm DNA-binding domain